MKHVVHPDDRGAHRYIIYNMAEVDMSELGELLGIGSKQKFNMKIYFSEGFNLNQHPSAPKAGALDCSATRTGNGVCLKG